MQKALGEGYLSLKETAFRKFHMEKHVLTLFASLLWRETKRKQK